MLKGSIKTRDNILNKFKNLTKHVSDLSLRIDKDFVEMDNIQDDAAGKDYHKNSKIYTYLAENVVDLRRESIDLGPTIILSFRVCNFAMKPFIQYSCIMQEDKTLDFEEINLTDREISKISSGKYYGKLENSKKQVLIFESICDRENQVNEISVHNKYFWLSVDEVMNAKHSFGIKINDRISSLLIEHEELLYLQDEDGILIETPMIGYRGEYYKKMAFIAGLGMPRSGPYSSLGPYYSFADFARSLRYACITLDGKPKEVFGELITRDNTPVFTKGGMVKFVIFLGKTKVMLNKEADPKDDTDESLKLAQERQFFSQLLRLRDSSGKWTEHYDSVIQPVMKIFDKESNRERELDSQFTVKEYSQQTPIQYAYFNTDSIDLDETTGFYNIKKATLM